MNPEVESNPAMITRTSTELKALGTSSGLSRRRPKTNSGDVAQVLEFLRTQSSSAGGFVRNRAVDFVRPIDEAAAADRVADRGRAVDAKVLAMARRVEPNSDRLIGDA